MLFILQHYELNVNEIVQVVDMIQSGVSRHLKILLESGLLKSRKEGSFTYYSAAFDTDVEPLFQMVEKQLSLEKLNQKDLEKSAQMLTIRQDRTKRFFSTVAPQWDRLKREVLGDFDLNAAIKERIQFNGHVSDVGCGTGELIETLQASTRHKLIGIDSSPEMLEQARLRLTGVPKTELRLGEAEYLPMKNQEIDTAVMSMVLHHIPQPKRSIAEVYRVIRPGGQFILSDFEKHDNESIKEIIGGEWLGFEKQLIYDWLAQEGFAEPSVESFRVNHGLMINIFIAKKPHVEEKI